jgi:DNA-binding transcriptional LysR family regulator
MDWSDRIGRRLKLRDLHILLAVVQWGSISRAAEHLAISHPVVSKAIADLEHALGVRLFDRSPKGIEPTEYGRAFLASSRAVFDELRQGVQNSSSWSTRLMANCGLGAPNLWRRV